MREQTGEEEPIQGWAALEWNGGGLAVINDGKYSASARDNELRVTVVRSPIYAHDKSVLPKKDGHYDYMDQGEHRFRFLIVPYCGTWADAGIPSAAEDFNQALIGLPGYPHAGTLPDRGAFMSVAGEGVSFTALKRAEDGGGFILRGYECAGRRSRAGVSIPSQGISFSAAFGPHEIKTFLVSRARPRKVREVDLLEEPV